ncbi:hypothetical protein GBAR_LOCUS20527 [Geodia barretti]|uniref:Uncharacterized protein n=1 Tax=Geodia barretti TaxID=519541 RepID=A0AA35SWF7_GEOBA|nr:hypothetical protein GBAR_LOCUS20527 [Geodia barretti]
MSDWLELIRTIQEEWSSVMRESGGQFAMTLGMMRMLE